jgi:hypothetical protein
VSNDLYGDFKFKNILPLFKLMTWNATRDWCMQKGMRLPMIKISSEMEEVKKELNNRGFSKIISNI